MSVLYDEKLLDKTGLAMVPSAYKGAADIDNNNGFLGKVYSVLPIQTTEDVYDHSLVNVASGDWSINPNETYTIGVGDANGYLDFISTGNSNEIVAGSDYVFSFNITGAATHTIRIYLGSSVLYNNTISDGNFSISFQGTSSADNLRVRCFTTLTETITISDVSINRTTDGDFDFSRGSDATRVNSQGYIESVQVIGDELVQNGDFEEVSETEEVTNGGFDTDSDWSTVGVSPSYENSTVIFENNARIYQTLSGVDLAKKYKVVINFNDISGDGMQIYFGVSFSKTYSISDIVNNNYTIEEYVSFAGNNNLYIYSQTINTYAVIDNVSVKEVGQNWTFGNGWSIEDDGGNLKATRSSIAIDSNLQYSSILTNNKKYRISFDISNLTIGNIGVRIGSTNSNDLVADENKSYSFDTIADGSAIIFRARNSFDGSIDNISVVEITDDTDIPRLDYSDGCPTLLLEPERRNVMTESVLPTDWTGSPADVASAIAPDGSNSAVSWNTSSSPTGYYKGAVLQATGDIVMSVFAKDVNNSGDVGKIRVGSDNPYFGTGSQTAYIEFDVSTETVTSSTAGVSDYGYEVYKNGWYRVWVKANVPSQLTINFIAYTLNSSTSNARMAVWGYQVESGSYPTSYIPTNGEGVTRLADICNNAGDSTIFNDSEGVLYAEVSSIANDSSVKKIKIKGIGGTNAQATISYHSNSNQLRCITFDGTTVKSEILATIYNVERYNKIAYRYEEGNSVLYVNGVEIGSSNDTGLLSGITLTDMTFSDTTDSPMYGNVRSVLYFNEALSNAELEYITSSDIDVVLQNNKLKATMLGDTYEDGHVEDRLNELF